MVNTGIRSQRQKQSDDFIRSQLIRLRPGDPLPSLRQLMKSSGLGRIMLEKSLAKALEKDLIRTEPRRGYFRTESENNMHNARAVSIIGCSCVGYHNCESFQNHLIQQLFQLGSDRDISMWVHTVAYQELADAYRELVHEKQICNCFLISPENREIAKHVRATGTNCVVIAPHYDVHSERQEGPAVVDAADLIDLQMDYLFAHGHRHVAFIHADGEFFSSYPHLLRRERYYCRMAQAGNRVDPSWVIPAWSPEPRFKRDLENMLQSHPRPTAIICHEYYLPLVYAVLAARQLVVGRDISVITDGEGSRLRPVPTMVLNSPQAMAELSWVLMENILEGRPEGRIVSPKLEIQEGKSVADIPYGV